MDSELLKEASADLSDAVNMFDSDQQSASLLVQMSIAKSLLAIAQHLDNLTGSNLSGDDYLRIRNQ